MLLDAWSSKNAQQVTTQNFTRAVTRKTGKRARSLLGHFLWGKLCVFITFECRSKKREGYMLNSSTTTAKYSLVDRHLIYDREWGIYTCGKYMCINIYHTLPSVTFIEIFYVNVCFLCNVSDHMIECNVFEFYKQVHMFQYTSPCLEVYFLF